eukprot:COSAG02_NODE_45544_length_356_cov_0.797665_1_plen_40_part_01
MPLQLLAEGLVGPSRYGADAPQFHVRDYSCGMNDPAAVVY